MRISNTDSALVGGKGKLPYADHSGNARAARKRSVFGTRGAVLGGGGGAVVLRKERRNLAVFIEGVASARETSKRKDRVTRRTSNLPGISQIKMVMKPRQ